MSNCAAVSPISEHEEWCVPWDIWMVIRSGDLSAECVDHVRNRLDLKHARMDMTLLRPSAFSHTFIVSWLQCYPLVKQVGIQLTSCIFVLCLVFSREARALYI